MAGRGRSKVSQVEPSICAGAQRSVAFCATGPALSGCRFLTFFRNGPQSALRYCAVSVNVAIGCPSPYGPSAVTVTGPAVDGNVSVTGGVTPEPFVTTIIFCPLCVPSDSTPPLAVNNTLAPIAVPPDCPGVRVTANGRGSGEPLLPVCPSPPVVAKPCRRLAHDNPSALSLCNTRTIGSRRREMAESRRATRIHSNCPVRSRGDRSGGNVHRTRARRRALISVEPSVPNVTLSGPLVIIGFRVTVPPAGTMMVSGLRSHSELGWVASGPRYNEQSRRIRSHGHLRRP